MVASSPPVPKKEHGTAKAAGPFRALFSSGAFWALFGGSLAACLGDRLYQMALIVAAQDVFGNTDSENRVVLIQLAGTLPQFLLYPVVGPFVDERNRRRLLCVVTALKAVAVVVLAPLLWNTAGTSPEAFGEDRWWTALAIVFLLNLVSLPFSPGRAATVPDVAPRRYQELAASLAAITGLFGLLVGSMGGGLLAQQSCLGTSNTVLLSAGLFFVGALWLRRLPRAATVPNVLRAATAATAATGAREDGSPGTPRKGYFAELWAGWNYCRKTAGVVTLIIYESLFWLCATLFYYLWEWQARVVLGVPSGDQRTMHFALGMGATGVGLLLGALAVGRLCREYSPLLTYPFSFLLMSLGTAMVFGPERTAAMAGELYPWAFLTGFGAGFLLGRIDADVLALVDEEMRGRVFAFKGFFFTGALLLTMTWLSSSWAPGEALARGIPVLLSVLALLALPTGWRLDCALWRDRGGFAPVGRIRRFWWGLIRGVARLLTRVYFRAEIKGLEKIPRKGPVIIAANHACFLDPIFLGAFSPRYAYYIMARSYYRTPAHPVFRFFRTVPVELGEGNLKALRVGVNILKRGDALGIFPEGRVSDDGQLQRPQTGALFLARQSGATVVPVAIKGNHAAMPRQAKFPLPRKVTLLVGEPFKVSPKATKAEMLERADRLMAELAELLELPAPPSAAAARHPRKS